MEFTEWMAQVEALFQSELHTTASSSGWVWSAIFEEGMTPREAFEDYLHTIAR